jgi:DNA methylase
VYGHLAVLAAQVLKPGGSLLCMAGQSYLAEIYALMTPYLRSHWELAYLLPGANSTQHHRRVLNAWKPILWFTRGEYTGPYIHDVVKSVAPDKDYHHWGQSESGMAALIDLLSFPCDTILDPFVGGGTTGAVAIRMGRKLIGLDSDADAVKTTRHRLHQVAVNAAPE